MLDYRSNDNGAYLFCNSNILCMHSKNQWQFKIDRTPFRNMHIFDTRQQNPYSTFKSLKYAYKVLPISKMC